MGPQWVASVVAYQVIQEWVREAEAERLSSSARAAHAGGTTVRRLGHELTQGVLAPVRFLHTSHHEVRQDVGGRRVAA